MNTAVIGTSKKEHERRVAIHPKHLAKIPEGIRRSLFFEKDYGKPFGVTDEQITKMTGNPPEPRDELLGSFGAVIIPKPVREDFEEMRSGTNVWGWIHCVQQTDITQIAIEKKMTLIAWENMYHTDGRSRVHIFQKNNEMAGYCGVQHALQGRGIDGNFGPQRKAVVLSFGSVSRGAVCALRGHGIQDIAIYTRRPSALVGNRIPGIRYGRILQENGSLTAENPDGSTVPLIDVLTGADIVVNGILQDPANPVVFIRDRDILKFRKECLVIDVSCDKGMGFQFAHPTDFTRPFCRLGNILYYSVDHTPTLLWDSASWEISASLLAFLPDFVSQAENTVLKNAVDIENGTIRNREILDFQKRSPVYPYPRKHTDCRVNA